MRRRPNRKRTSSSHEPDSRRGVFALVLTKPAAERAAWLDRECGDDKGLRQRVEARLQVREQAADSPASQNIRARGALRPSLFFTRYPSPLALCRSRHLPSATPSPMIRKPIAES
jgi:hypothetical protein